AGKSGERAGTGLGVVALGVAALADLRRGCDIDFVEELVGNAARGIAVIARGRNGCDDRDVTILGEVRCDFGKPADVLAAVPGRKAEIAVQPRAQGVAVE